MNSTKRNNGSGGRPWCVADQTWATALEILTDAGYERTRGRM